MIREHTNFNDLLQGNVLWIAEEEEEVVDGIVAHTPRGRNTKEENLLKCGFGFSQHVLIFC